MMHLNACVCGAEADLPGCMAMGSWIDQLHQGTADLILESSTLAAETAVTQFGLQLYVGCLHANA